MDDFRFEKLDVWRKSMDWVKVVYQATQEFPKSEQHGLTSQLRRAAVSVPSNIAEGTGRTSDADFVRFIEIAYGSLMEATCQLHLAVELGYLRTEDLANLKASAAEIARMLSGLRKHRLHL
jgi:four helix bundle protein